MAQKLAKSRKKVQYKQLHQLGVMPVLSIYLCFAFFIILCFCFLHPASFCSDFFLNRPISQRFSKLSCQKWLFSVAHESFHFRGTAGSRLEMLNESYASVQVPTIQEHSRGRDLGLCNYGHVWLVDLSDCWMQKRKLANNHTCAELSLEWTRLMCFFGCGASRCLWATHGTLTHWGCFLMGRIWGTASVLLCRYVNVKTLWPELHSDDFVCTCCNIVPHHSSRGRRIFPRSWGVKSVAPIPSVCWALKPLQKGSLAILVHRPKSPAVSYCF